MDRAGPEYSQSGLNSPVQGDANAFVKEQTTETTSIDQASAAHYAQPEVRSNANGYSTTATPTSDYGVHPQSARSGSYPEHVQRQYYSNSNHSGSSGSMSQQPTSPSIGIQADGRDNHQNHSQLDKSDAEVPIDPSIATSSPSFPPQPQYHGQPQHSPYPPQDGMTHGYAAPQGPMYAQPRPDWSGYGQPHPQHGMAPYPLHGQQTPTSAAPAGQQRPGGNQVYSFVPIPGAQQHKRPRRRYEEIERMYKCGWNGCEKAYGTLNHLNAHVTMQSHGQKRTPEEFKEIRKEWKARKKEEENARKADDERARQQVPQAGPGDQPADGPQSAGYAPTRSVQLPPIGYGAQNGQPQYSAPPDGVQQLQGYQQQGHMYSGYPASPYGANAPSMYAQHGGAPPTKYEH